MSNDKDVSVISALPLKYLGKSLNVFADPIINQVSTKDEDEIMKSLLKFIHSPVLSLQLGAYIALNNLTDVLVERDKKLIAVENFEDLKSLNLCKFEQVLKTAQTIVNAILMDFK